MSWLAPIPGKRWKCHKVNQKSLEKFLQQPATQKILKYSFPDFTSNCFRKFKNRDGSVADLGDFKRDIIFTKEDKKYERFF